MSKPRLTTPGITDLHWMSVVCTPETTHVEFHESGPEAEEVALGGMLQRCSAYTGQVIRQGENKVKPAHAHRDVTTVVIGFTLDRETRAALNKYNGANSRGDYANTLRGLLEADLDVIRDEYRAQVAKLSQPFQPWAKCKSIDECEAWGSCCNGCQGKPAPLEGKTKACTCPPSPVPTFLHGDGCPASKP